MSAGELQANRAGARAGTPAGCDGPLTVWPGLQGARPGTDGLAPLDAAAPEIVRET